MAVEEVQYKVWRKFVAEMDFCDLNLKDQNKENTYTRFVDHVKACFLDSINGKGFYMEKMNNSSCDDLPENWWEIAMGIHNGKMIRPIINQDDDDRSESEDSIDEEEMANPGKLLNRLVDTTKKKAYSALLPAYAAIRESYDSRFKLFSWIFDHARYTAERDCMKALSGMLQALTEDSKEEIDRRYREFKEEVKLSPEELKRFAKIVKKDKLKITNPEKAKKLEEELAKEKTQKLDKNMANFKAAEEDEDENYDYEADEEVNDNESENEIDNNNNEREQMSNNESFVNDVNDDERENDVSNWVSENDELNKSTISINNK